MKNLGIHHIEKQKFQILDGTENYVEFYVSAKLTYMVYLQNGKSCRLEVDGSVDDSYIPDYEATIHFDGKTYDLLHNRDVEVLAKILGCNPNAIYGLRPFIEEEFNDIRRSIPGHYSDELPDGVSIKFESIGTPGYYDTNSEYSYSMKVGEKNIPINVQIYDHEEYGYVKSIMFDLGADAMIHIMYGSVDDDIYTNSGRENYEGVVKLEKLLGLKPGDGMKIIQAIDHLNGIRLL